MPRNLREALASIRNRQFLKTVKFQQQQLRANREGVHPDLLEFERTFIKRMAGIGVPMFCHCAYRTLAQQRMEYIQGDSKVLEGHHNYGGAMDIIHGTLAWGLTKEAWRLVGHVGKELITQKGYAIENLAWGGEWGFYDPAHWQISDLKTNKEHFPWPTLIPKPSSTPQENSSGLSTPPLQTPMEQLEAFLKAFPHRKG